MLDGLMLRASCDACAVAWQRRSCLICLVVAKGSCACPCSFFGMELQASFVITSSAILFGVSLTLGALFAPHFW